ncbi:MAG: zinc-binding alcohol dehydrogenase family protein [Schleiferilactobacillus harbinensis]|jgi:zinc-binding alcohol dehydrogenase family protein|nr:zinc-binding alcohol dehydrogenase family protein [Schleiferilactobacillus harbinensis]
MLPTKMRAVAAFQALPIRDPNSLQDVWLPLPTVQDNDVLVRVQAISMNPADVRFRHAIRGKTRPHVLGYDGVGEIVAVGTQVHDYAIGDRVYYMSARRRHGTNAEYQVIDQHLIAKAPRTGSLAQIAALPLTAITAWELLFERMDIRPAAGANNGSIMVVNAAGGVGSILIQLAQWAGLDVIGVASRVNWPWLQKFGVTQLADYHDDLTSQVQKLGYDYIDYIALLYDPVPYFGTVADVIAPMGHVGMVVDSNTPLPVDWLKGKSVSIDWEYVFAKSDYAYRMNTQGEILRWIVELVDDSTIKSTIAYKFNGINAQNLRQAQAMLETKNTIGKITLEGPFDGDAKELDDVKLEESQSYVE